MSKSPRIFTPPRAKRTLAAAAGFALIGGIAQAEPLSVTILHVNDLDRMEDDDGRGGVAKLAGLIAEEKASNPNVIVTNGGDAISPSLMSAFDQGAHMIDLYNSVGFDVMVLGNHEFDFGPEILKERIAEANFPMLGGNAIDSDGEPVDGSIPTWTTTVGDYTLGFLGLTTQGTAIKSSPGSVTFSPIVETAEALAAELRDGGADLVIALAHTDVAEDRELVEAGAVDLILSGDDHLLTLHYNGDTALVESYAQAEYVTAVDLTLDRVERGDSTRFVWTPSFRVIDTISASAAPDVQEMVDGYLQLLSDELDIEIGSTETELDSRRSTIRAQEATIGNLIADAMREAVGADIAITNGGGIRADKIYDPGTSLTRRDIQSELPFGNKTVSIALTGQNVIDALENGFSGIEDGSGRFPHVSGLSVTYDGSAEPGSRVQKVIVGDKEIDPAAVYTVATNDFLANGGDGYSVFTTGKMIIDPTAGRYMAAQVIEYIEANAPVAPVIEGRINAAN